MNETIWRQRVPVDWQDVVITEQPSVDDLVRRASVIWGVSSALIRSPIRAARIAEARMAVYLAAYETGRYSLPQIGRILCRDHTSVLHGIAKMRHAKDPELLAKLEALRGSSETSGE